MRRAAIRSVVTTVGILTQRRSTFAVLAIAAIALAPESAFGQLRPGRRALTLPSRCLKNIPPVADAGPAQAAETGELITFDGSASYDPDGWVRKYYWDFGDGQTGRGLTTTHSYDAPGSYTAALTVTDGCEATSEESYALVTVVDADPCAGNQPPTAAAGPDREVETGVDVFFDASASSDSDGTLVSYEWHFGDGATGSGAAVTHVYGAETTYTVVLTVTDECGASAQDTVFVEAIAPGDPGEVTADFDVDVNPAQVGDLVTFTASAPPAEVLYYIWDFSDSGQTNGSGPVVTHIYEEVGDFAASLSVVTPEYDVFSSEVIVAVQPGLTLLGQVDAGDITVARALAIRTSDGDGAKTAWLGGEPDLLLTVDVTDPANPTPLGSRSFSGIVNDVVVNQDLAAVAANGQGVYWFDAYDPMNLGQSLGHYDTYADGQSYALGVALRDRTLYVARGWSGVSVIDLSDPESPEYLPTVDGVGYAQRLLAKGGRLYVGNNATAGGAEPTIEVFDISAPHNPAYVGSVLRGGTAETVDMDFAGTTLAVAAGVDGMKLFYIPETNDPLEFENQWETLGQLDDCGDGFLSVALMGDRLFACEAGVIWKADVSDPAEPRSMENLCFANNAYSVQAANGFIYGALGEGIIAVMSP